MTTLATDFGVLPVQSGAEYYPSGALHSCIASEKARLDTPLGPLTPQFTANTLRKRQLPCITFHENGMLRSLPLEEQVAVPTPLGDMPAEFVTFYPGGQVKRVFPLNGRLSGFWSQENEAALTRPLNLATPLGEFELTVTSAYFGPQGALRSLTLWPGTEIDLPCPCGPVPTRIGMAFFDTGALKSVEPARSVAVPTPLGELSAFNPDAHGISGDINSLCFSPSGEVAGLATIANAFEIVGQGRMEPRLRKSYCDGTTLEPAPLFVTFTGDRVAFHAENAASRSAPLDSVVARDFTPPLPLLFATCAPRTSW